MSSSSPLVMRVGPDGFDYPITAIAEDHVQPSWSPDGRFLALAKWGGEIRLMSFTGGTPFDPIFVSSQWKDFAWSPRLPIALFADANHQHWTICHRQILLPSLVPRQSLPDVRRFDGLEARYDLVRRAGGRRADSSSDFPECRARRDARSFLARLELGGIRDRSRDVDALADRHGNSGRAFRRQYWLFQLSWTSDSQAVSARNYWSETNSEVWVRFFVGNDLTPQLTFKSSELSSSMLVWQPIGTPLIVLETGDADEAIRRLSDLDAKARRILVVLDELDAGLTTRLVAAGAADVITHPLAPDVLARKLRRLARRPA